MSEPSESGVQSPHLVYRRGDVRTAIERAGNRGLKLRLCGPHATTVASATGVNLVAIDRASDVFDGTATDVVLTSPAVSPDELDAMRVLDNPPMLTVDHFAQVEMIAERAWRQAPRLLIELSLGPARFGGRPGRDAVDLAQAISSTDGVVFGGLSAAVSSTGMADSLLRTAEQIEAAGFAVPLMSAAAGPDEMDGLPSGHEVRQAVAPACLAVRVLSRPSLETCVIDAGLANGLQAKQTVQLGRSPQRPESDAHVRAIEESRSLLTIAGESVEALIGDIVFVTMTGIPRANAATVI